MVWRPEIKLSDDLMDRCLEQAHKVVKGRQSPIQITVTLSGRTGWFSAPKDFTLHAARHTVATWMEKNGKSPWERGLILNHAASGVTAGYSHGYPIDIKRDLLSERAQHVESLVQPEEGVALLH